MDPLRGIRRWFFVSFIIGLYTHNTYGIEPASLLCFFSSLNIPISLGWASLKKLLFSATVFSPIQTSDIINWQEFNHATTKSVQASILPALRGQTKCIISVRKQITQFWFLTIEASETASKPIFTSNILSEWPDLKSSLFIQTITSLDPRHSAGPVAVYNTLEMAKDLVDLLDFLGWHASRTLHVIGNSLGGMIAQKLVRWPLSQEIINHIWLLLIFINVKKSCSLVPLDPS